MRQTKEITIGKHKLTITELTGDEVALSYNYIRGNLHPVNQSGAFMMALGLAQAICAVRVIDGRHVNACESDLDYDVIAKEILTGRECMDLSGEYATLSDIPDGEELKNSSADQISTP